MTDINSNAWTVLANLLELASDEFSSHGCNDYTLPNTPENRALLEAAERWNSEAEFLEYGLNISKDGTSIYVLDWFLMSYFAHLAKEFALGESDE